MKKLFFLLSFFAIAMSLSSCGAQEECRPRGGYTQVLEKQQTPVIAFHQIAENK